MAKNKGIEFLLKVGQDMGILPGGGETEGHYAERVILSAGAKWMLTAVHNDSEKTSIEQVKKITRDKIENYFEILGYELPLDVLEIVDYIYETLLANGMFYHEQYYVRPVHSREIGIEEVSFIRGLLPEEKACFSGLTPYLPGGGNDVLADEFMLWQINGEETLKLAWMRASQQDCDTEIGEYLRADRQTGQRYYDVRREDRTEYTLGRTRRGDAHVYDYFLIKGNEFRRLSDDFVNAAVHAYAAVAIVNGCKRQTAKAKISKELVDLELGYLLPKPDRRFLQFVSWPVNLQMLSKPVYRCSLHPRVWPIIRTRLSFLGFAVEERYE